MSNIQKTPFKKEGKIKNLSTLLKLVRNGNPT